MFNEIIVWIGYICSYWQHTFTFLWWIPLSSFCSTTFLNSLFSFSSLSSMRWYFSYEMNNTTNQTPTTCNKMLVLKLGSNNWSGGYIVKLLWNFSFDNEIKYMDFKVVGQKTHLDELYDNNLLLKSSYTHGKQHTDCTCTCVRSSSSWSWSIFSLSDD